MEQRDRISGHIRSNAVGYVALFCFAIGGTAQALPGNNSVNSGDIQNGKVKLVDLATNSVDGSKVVDDSLAAADIAAGGVDDQELSDDLANTIDQNDIAIGGVDELELNDNLADSINADDIQTGGVDELELNDSLADSINADDIQTGGVDDAELNDDLDDTITGNDIATEAVASLEVNDGSLVQADVSEPGVTVPDVPIQNIPGGQCRTVNNPGPDIGGRPPGSLVWWTQPSAGDVLPLGLLTIPLVVAPDGQAPVLVCNRTGADIDPDNADVVDFAERRLVP